MNNPFNLSRVKDYGASEHRFQMSRQSAQNLLLRHPLVGLTAKKTFPALETF
ncbi:MAG: hypothetical protein ACPGAL_01920 [Luminiphilus sp.]